MNVFNAICCSLDPISLLLQGRQSGSDGAGGGLAGQSTDEDDDDDDGAAGTNGSKAAIGNTDATSPRLNGSKEDAGTTDSGPDSADDTFECASLLNRLQYSMPYASLVTAAFHFVHLPAE